MARVTKAQQHDAIHYLTDNESYHLQPGETVYTSHHAPATYLRLFAIRQNSATGEYYPANITHLAARALGIAPKDKGGEWYLQNTVVGMDRGFDVVYRLSYKLFGDGYALNHRWL